MTTDRASHPADPGERPVTVGVVVPARNEEEHVGKCVRAVREQLAGYAVHVVVVDDASTDGTAGKARSAGADVVPATPETDTIAAVRNHGVRHTRGEVLVFLDADVTVVSPWGRRFREIDDQLRPPSRLLTGHTCRVPADASWIERVWFAERLDRPTHLGSAHLIMSRQFFEELEGFDEDLVTGEDYDLSRRALQKGGTIRLDPDLVAIHHGFPRTVFQFARREVWHGLGDVTTISRFLHSKVALASAAFLFLHAMILLAAVLAWPAAAGASAIGIASLLSVVALQKFGIPRGAGWLKVLPLLYVYFTCRAFSLFRRLWNGPSPDR